MKDLTPNERDAALAHARTLTATRSTDAANHARTADLLREAVDVLLVGLQVTKG